LNITDLIICALAGSAVVDIWFNGSVFADQLSLVEARADWCCTPEVMRDASSGYADDAGPAIEPVETWVNRCPCLLVQLLSCAHCLSFHTPLWIMVWYFGVGIFPDTLTFVLRLPVFSLAAGRLMNIITHISGKPYQT
jgi:hypothetical protein